MIRELIQVRDRHTGELLDTYAVLEQIGRDWHLVLHNGKERMLSHDELAHIRWCAEESHNHRRRAT